LAHTGPVCYIILNVTRLLSENKLWLQCAELSKSDTVSRKKSLNVYEKCRSHSEAKCSHNSKVIALYHVLNKLSKTLIMNCDLNNTVYEMCYVCRSVC
jgi:hypothetical protein